MRILLSTGPSYGLYFPVVPLAWALRLAGHDVLVAGPESMAATVNGSGLQFVAICEPLDMRDVMLHDRAGRPLTPPVAEDELIAFTGRGFGRLAARTADGLVALVDRWRPDVVVSEPHAYSAALAAAVHGVPLVEHGVGMGYHTSIDEWGAQELAPELGRLGLTGKPRPDLVLDPCPPSVRSAAAGPAQPMRYVAFDKPATVPSWVFGKRERPRVLVTLGTVPAVGRVPLFKELLRTLPSLGCELVVAAGDDLMAQLPSMPEAVIAAGWQPLASVLPACDFAVHHCGGGTTMMALLAGLPQLLVPLIVEQHDSARRLRDFGAARRFETTEVEPAEVVESCRALVEDPSYRERARALGEEIRTMPSLGEVVTVVENLAARPATRQAA